MGYGTISQIVLVIVSIVIIVTYIQPTFAELRLQQDEIAEYAEAVDKASQFNARLDQLLAQASSFSQTDLRQLETFLPEAVDSVAVAQDIETIARANQMLLTNIAFADSAATPPARSRSVEADDEGSGSLRDIANANLTPTQFTISVSGSYEAFKDFLRALEANAYPLEVVSLGFGSAASPTEGSQDSAYTFALTLETYALDAQPN